MLALPAVAQTERGAVTTTAFSRALFLNPDAPTWLAALGVSGGSNGVAYDVTYSFFLNGANNTLSIRTNAVLWSPTFNGLTATNFAVLSNMLLTVNGVIITNQVSGKVYDFGDINTGNTIASWADVTNIILHNTSGGGGGTNGGIPLLAGTNAVVYLKNGTNIVNGVTDTNAVLGVGSTSSNALYGYITGTSNGIPSIVASNVAAVVLYDPLAIIYFANQNITDADAKSRISGFFSELRIGGIVNNLVDANFFASDLNPSNRTALNNLAVTNFGDQPGLLGADFYPTNRAIIPITMASWSNTVIFDTLGWTNANTNAVSGTPDWWGLYDGLGSNFLTCSAGQLMTAHSSAVATNAPCLVHSSCPIRTISRGTTGMKWFLLRSGITAFRGRSIRICLQLPPAGPILRLCCREHRHYS